MQIKASYLRARKYFQRHGAKATVKRALLSVRNHFFFNREVVFWVDLLNRKSEEPAIQEKFVVERMEERSEIPNEMLKCLAEHQAEELLDNNLRERFERGASLWCLRMDGDFIGYIWSSVGKAMKPHYLPLTERDVHLFDNFIFPKYRGRMQNSILMNHVLDRLKIQGLQRAYIETAEWNHLELKSLAKIRFVRIGLAKRRFRQGKSIVTWWY